MARINTSGDEDAQELLIVEHHRQRDDSGDEQEVLHQSPQIEVIPSKDMERVYCDTDHKGVNSFVDNMKSSEQSSATRSNVSRRGTMSQRKKSVPHYLQSTRTHMVRKMLVQERRNSIN